MNLVADRGGHKVHGAARVLLIGENTGDGFLIPSVWVGILLSCFSAKRSVIGGGDENLFLFKLLCDLQRTSPVKAECVDFPHNIRCRFVYQPVLLILWVLDIAERDGGTDPLAVCRLVLPYRADFLARLSSIPLVKYVVERHHLRACFLEGIYIFLNGNEPDAEGRVFDFKVVAHIKIIPAKTTEILYDDGIYQALFHHVLHLDETRSVEGRPRKSVIREKLRVRKTIPLCVCK